MSRSLSGKSFIFLQVGCFLSSSFFNLPDILLCKEDCHPHTSTYGSRKGSSHLQASVRHSPRVPGGTDGNALSCFLCHTLCQVLSVNILMSLQLLCNLTLLALVKCYYMRGDDASFKKLLTHSRSLMPDTCIMLVSHSKYLQAYIIG